MANSVLVIGATGAMGKAVVRALLADDQIEWTVRAFTRDPASKHADQLLAESGGRVELYQGHLDDEATVRRAFSGVDGAFVNTDFFSSLSVRHEYEQGLRVLEAARREGVPGLVYSSLDSVASITAGTVLCPHYDAKAGVASYIDMMRSDEFMRKEKGFYASAVSVLVTAPYYENFQSQFPPEPGRLTDGRDGMIFTHAGGGKPHPMIGLDDIAWFAREMLRHPAVWGGRTLRVLGDARTLDEVASDFEKATGIPAEWRDLPLEAVEQIPRFGHDLANMYRFYQEYGVDRDLSALRRIHPGLMTFADWLQRTGWRGERAAVQSSTIIAPTSGSRRTT